MEGASRCDFRARKRFNQRFLNSVVEDVTAINNEDGGNKKHLLELLLYYFSKELRMPLDKFTPEEIEMLKGIFERSGRYKAELRSMNKGRKKGQ